jgi:hypothetical protein
MSSRVMFVLQGWSVVFLSLAGLILVLTTSGLVVLVGALLILCASSWGIVLGLRRFRDLKSRQRSR